MLFTTVVLSALAATAAAKPMKRGKKCTIRRTATTLPGSAITTSTGTATLTDSTSTPGGVFVTITDSTGTVPTDTASLTVTDSTKSGSSPSDSQSSSATGTATGTETGTQTGTATDGTETGTQTGTQTTQTGTATDGTQTGTQTTQTGTATDGTQTGTQTDSTTTGVQSSTATDVNSSTTSAATSATSSAATSATSSAATSATSSAATSVTSSAATSATSATSTLSTSTISSTSSSASASATSCIPPKRASVGTVQTGVTILECTDKNHVALTFDDGPYEWTAQILGLLDAEGWKGTFFMNGDNWGSIYDYESTVLQVANTGHQVGSHTWKHIDMGVSSSCDIASNLTQLEDAFMTILGKYPTYLRPPYLSMSDNALSIAGDLGYRVVSIDLDTKDYENTGLVDPSTGQVIGDPQIAIDNYKNGYKAGAISLAHDVHKPTADIILPAIIAFLKGKQMTSVTVGQCLGEAEEFWYATK